LGPQLGQDKQDFPSVAEGAFCMLSVSEPMQPIMSTIARAIGLGRGNIKLTRQSTSGRVICDHVSSQAFFGHADKFNNIGRPVSDGLGTRFWLPLTAPAGLTCRPFLGTTLVASPPVRRQALDAQRFLCAAQKLGMLPWPIAPLP
jgi:hypothetical protein